MARSKCDALRGTRSTYELRLPAWPLRGVVYSMRSHLRVRVRDKVSKGRGRVRGRDRLSSVQHEVAPIVPQNLELALYLVVEAVRALGRLRHHPCAAASEEALDLEDPFLAARRAHEAVR